MKTALNIELNACMGGMSEGFRRAGVHFDMAVDYDPNACESHERNIGLRPIQMDIHDLLRMARIGAFRPRVNLFVADPPCTPYSMAGDRKGLEDERDLLPETVELIDILRPRAWIIGNVPGLDKADNWEGVVEPVIYKPARAAGYCVDYSTFNAADYGTPQCRHRPFWFGHPVGTQCIRWEQPTHAQPPVLPGLGIKPWVSCGEALEEAFGPREKWGAEVGRSVRLRRRGQNARDGLSKLGKPARTVGTSNLSDESAILVNDKHAPPSINEPSTTIRGGGRGHSAPQTILTYDDRHRPSKIDEVAVVVRASSGAGARNSVDLRKPDPNRPMADPREPHRSVTTQSADTAILADDLNDAGLLDRPSTTIGLRDEITTPGYHDPKVAGAGNSGILLSEQALVVIQGFPRTWHVAGTTKTARMSQIGQAMPPQLSEAVAIAISKWFASLGGGK